MTKASLTLLLLTCALLSSSLINGQTTDCPLSSDIDLAGDGSLLLRQVINPSTSTVSVELEYIGVGWVALAFSVTKKMTPNTAIVGLPDEGTVQKYDLTAENLSGVLPASADRQTLTDATIVQENGVTTLKFTRALEEANENSVVEGSNMINVAYGSSNTLAMHVFSLSTTADFTACTAAAVTSTPVAVPVAVPVAAPAAVAVPSEAPVTAPVAVPTEAPVAVPVEVPVKTPSEVPLVYPSEVPSEVPVEVPVKAPTNATAPVKVPVKAPVSAPTPTTSYGNQEATSLLWMIGCIVSSTLILNL